MPRTQYFSHWLSCGQTRPQTAGRELVLGDDLIGLLKVAGGTFLMNSGIWIITGQPLRAGGVLAVQAALGLVQTAISGV
jgi:hypothetical protein